MKFQGKKEANNNKEPHIYIIHGMALKVYFCWEGRRICPAPSHHALYYQKGQHVVPNVSNKMTPLNVSAFFSFFSLFPY